MSPLAIVRNMISTSSWLGDDCCSDSLLITVRCLRSVGVPVDDSEPNTWRVEPGPVQPWSRPIEPDLSNATVFLAAAAVTRGSVTVPGWPADTTQAGDAFRDIAARMGCTVDLAPGGLTVTGPDSLRAIDIDLHDVGELTPTVAAMALFADGPSHLRGIGHLRGRDPKPSHGLFVVLWDAGARQIH